MFIIDKFAGATHIIDELTLVDSSWYAEKEAEEIKENELVEETINESDFNNAETMLTENMNFQDAFLMHWRNGDKSFTWNGVVYTTEREDKRTIEDAR